MVQYGSPSYWDERYAQQDGAHFDFYLEYEDLAPHIAGYLHQDDDFEVFIPGCGSSRLGVALHDQAGVRNISCADASSVVVEQMKSKYGGPDREDMDWCQIDATNAASLPDDAFDLTIDKALLDAVLTGDDSINRAGKMIAEMHRLLKRGGVYLVLSHGVPATRVGLISKFAPWASVEMIQIKKPRVEGFQLDGASAHYYLYVATKKL